MIRTLTPMPIPTMTIWNYNPTIPHAYIPQSHTHLSIPQHRFFCFCLFFPQSILDNRGRLHSLVPNGCHAPIVIGTVYMVSISVNDQLQRFYALAEDW